MDLYYEISLEMVCY